MRASLTYDDGVSQWTDPLLDVLAEHGAKCSFFVIGANIHKRENTLRRIVEEGHEVGVHTWTHRRVTELSDQKFRDELDMTSGLIQAVTGVKPTLWRPPHFDFNDHVETQARKAGLILADRTIDPSDWANHSAEGISEYVERELHNRAIVDLHDGIPPGGGNGTLTRQPTVDATALILSRCPDVDFVTLTELWA